MCKCVRDADLLDSLKPHYTKNDISTNIEFKNGAVNLQCTRFKTRIRPSQTQVRLILTSSPIIVSDSGPWSGLTGKLFVITAHPVQDR